MAMNPLPPQAYTKETLQKAYHWLLNQNASIKEMASNQEILISLYLKAQRNGEASLEAPSILNFKQELKNLAHMMGDFSSNTPAAIPGTTSSVLIEKNKPSVSPVTGFHFELDQHSQIVIQDVKETLNLSSDVEALRALISLGFKAFKKIN